eukprot:9487434-Pyramimonas_sp.AAC.1
MEIVMTFLRPLGGQSGYDNNSGPDVFREILFLVRSSDTFERPSQTFGVARGFYPSGPFRRFPRGKRRTAKCRNPRHLGESWACPPRIPPRRT